MACDDRQLTQQQRAAGFEQLRNAGVLQAVRPFSGSASLPNLIDYVNRELFPAVKQTRSKVNDVYRPVTDNAPSANPLAYYFSAETGAADPTVGRLRLNDATQEDATVVRVSQTNGRLKDVGAWLDMMAGSATEPLGAVTLFHATDPGRFIRFDLETMLDNGAYWDLGVTFVESSHDSPFLESDSVVLAFIPGVASSGATVPVGALSPIPADTFIGNITASTAPPVAVPLANVDSTSVIYDAASHTFQRAALTGDITAAQNSNATTLRNSAGVSVIGRHLASSAAPADIVSGAGRRFLMSNTLNTLIGFLQADVQDLFPIGDDRFLGNLSGATASPTATPFNNLDSDTIIYENTNKSFIRQALVGDVTAPQNNNTTTIAASAVTNAKMADMAQSRIKGRAEGAGTGAPTDLTPTQVMAIVNGENVAWTGNHSFTAATFSATMTGALSLESDSDMGIASVSGGLALGAGNVIVSPSVGNGDVVVNATGGVAITAGGSPISDAADNDIKLQAADDISLVATDQVLITSASVEVSGSATFDGSVRLNNHLRYEGDVEGSLGTVGTDFNPTGLSGAHVMRLTCNDVVELSGIVPIADGAVLHIFRVDTDPDNLLTLTHEDTASSAANRFILPGGASISVSLHGSISLWYDGTSNRWRVMGMPQTP